MDERLSVFFRLKAINISMKFIKVNDPNIAVEALAEKISESLKARSVLWLLPGGSNIPLSVRVMRIIRSKVSGEDLKNLTIALTDERYGPLGHQNSNWQQLMNSRLDVRDIKVIQVLTGKSLKETVHEYNRKMEEIFESHTLIIAQFGIGVDGHIAGVLPGSIGVYDKNFVCSYESSPFIRITLTLWAINKISIAYAFAFGPFKKAIVERLNNENDFPIKVPAQILKQIDESYLYAGE